MKTTIDIADPLLRRAKKMAAQQGMTLKELVEAALRQALGDTSRGRSAEPFGTHVVKGEGLQDGLEWGDWDALRAAAYEGRGG